jgi:hypothetical protein
MRWLVDELTSKTGDISGAIGISVSTQVLMNGTPTCDHCRRLCDTTPIQDHPTSCCRQMRAQIDFPKVDYSLVELVTIEAGNSTSKLRVQLDHYVSILKHNSLSETEQKTQPIDLSTENIVLY